jgi:hypothetical protein
MDAGINIPFPEEAALLTLSGLQPLPGAAEALAAVVNPGRFVWLANEHGVAAFVLRNITALQLTEMLASTEYQNLRNMSFKSVARNSFINESLKEATTILNEASLVPVLLKGCALELTVYDKGGLRPMTDADILLPAEVSLKAWQLLQDRGYMALPLKSPLHRLIIMHTGKHLPSLIKGGFSLEIHHSLFSGSDERLTASIIEESTLVYPGDGEPGRERVPPPALHFLYLVAHLAKHEEEGHSQLRLYNDLAAMIDHYGAEETAGRALHHSAAVNLEGILKDKLGLLRRYMGVNMPPEYQFEPSAAAAERFMAMLQKPKDNTPQDRKALYREKVRSVPGLHRKLLFLLGDILPSFTFMKKRYSKKSVLAILPYYLLRPGKLLWLLNYGRKDIKT